MSIGIVSSSQESDWKSCVRIVDNIRASYNKILKKSEYHSLYLPASASAYDSYKTAREIQKLKIKHLIFIDHKPHPLDLIEILSEISFLPEKITFHIYGDFVLFINDWFKVSKILKKIKCHFIVASEKQKKVLENLLVSGNKLISVCPFPVNDKNFYVDNDVRKKGLKKYKISEGERVFLYTGRISRDKKVLRLIELFKKHLEVTGFADHLFIAGDIDDIVNPVVGNYSHPGFFAHKFWSEIWSLDEKFRERIHIVGNLEDKELFELYNTADCFISLSLYHDEDYGMSPIEALFCGCNAILTDWGGYHSFKKSADNSCSLIKTNVDQAGATLDMNRALKLTWCVKTKNDQERASTSSFYKKSFSINACSKILKKLINHEGEFFRGFSEAGQVIALNKEAFISREIRFSRLYSNLYKNYATE